MRLSVQRNDLSRLLAAMKKVVEARNTIPVLSCVKLVADGNRLTATATDLDIEISASTSIMADVDGGVCVDAKLFDDIVRKMGADIGLELDGTTLHIRSGRSKFKLPVLPVADYPSFSQDDFTNEFEYDLAALFGPVRFAISTEETRYYLNGIYIHVADGKLTAVATDGHRLSRNIGTEAPEFEGIIVPRKMVGIVPPGVVKIALSNRKIRLVSDDCTITSKLIDGTFPDYRRVIPTGNDKVAAVDTEAAKASNARVATVGSAVKLTLANGAASLSVSENSNTASDEIEIGYSAEPIEIGFSAEYLAELFAVFPPGEVKMALADAGSPALFTSASAEGLLAVLMPRRI